MRIFSAVVAAASLAGAVAQTTYTGCHIHDTVSFCFGPDGKETAMTTLTAAVSISGSPTPVAATTTAEAQTIAITSCHLHMTDVYCINGAGDEVSVSLTGTPTGALPAQYTDCHFHGSEAYCVDPEGNDVTVLGATNEGYDHAEDEEADAEASEGEMNCHFHAGVEHCVAAGEFESASTANSACDAQPSRDYNVGLRIGSVFIILATSSIAVYFPLFLHKLPFGQVNSTLFTIVKQLGTGIIISTAFVHLYTHASLMFTNPCLTGINYESTTSAILMAGIFIAFVIEYSSYRVVSGRTSKTVSATGSSGSEEGSTHGSGKHIHESTGPLTSALQDISHSHAPFNPNTTLAVAVMEAGILFHSVLIGLTLVVAPDKSGNTSGYYNTLLAVVVFHQSFEGLALGGRIALLPNTSVTLEFAGKCLMAAAFALITPLGMAIGIGVLNQFNGNHQSTIITIGILDALSAGVLVWVGLVDMWARDWVVLGGEMVDAGTGKVLTGGFALVVGIISMSVLGKWI